MNGFTKGVAKVTSLKFGLEGLPKSGKTGTSLLMAEGLAKQSGKRIAYICSEPRGAAPFLLKIPSRAWHPEPFDLDMVETESLHEAREAVQKHLDLSKYGVVLVDSMSVLWDSAVASYSGTKPIPMNAWPGIKAPFLDFIDQLVKLPIHAIIVGRESVEMQEDTDGKLVKTGTKMRAEKETGYEVDTLIRIEAVAAKGSNAIDKKSRKKSGISLVPTAFPVDRWNLLNGKAIEWPTFENICGPYMPFLSKADGVTAGKTRVQAAKEDAETNAANHADEARISEGLRDKFRAEIDSAGNAGALEIVRVALSEAKPRMTQAHVVELADQFTRRRAQFNPANVADGIRSALISKLEKMFEGWSEKEVERKKAEVLHGRIGPWKDLSIAELRELAKVMEAQVQEPPFAEPPDPNQEVLI